MTVADGSDADRCPSVSVVIAAYQRPETLSALLRDLAAQDEPCAAAFEVIVVDDGSDPPLNRESGVNIPAGLNVRLVRQANAGPGAARDLGIRSAGGAVIVVVDDDMHVPPSFVAAHLAAHHEGSTVVMGQIREPSTDRRQELFDRFHLFSLDRFVQAYRRGQATLHGGRLCTGNVSFGRQAYLDVGGFDLTLRRCEDRDLGLRLEAAGARLAFAEAAWAQHCSDHSDVAAWLRRSAEWGAADVLISAKHPALDHAGPWSFFREIPRPAHPVVRAGALAPKCARAAATGVYRIATFVDHFGREREALSLTSLAYALAYYGGVGRQSGSIRATWRSYRAWRSAGAASDPMVGRSAAVTP